ncbi:hypothetical protein [Lactobacillus panisapium]|uniref:hypothetical protein n=2 Tax=Lactobacillus TaxID=1578 RepID=UPI00215DBDA7|nr:hypothetical protein [Lactobacillus panisapium]
MSMPVLIIFLILVGIISGVVSAVASMANITNTASLIFTEPSVLLASVKKMKGHWKKFSFYCLFLLTSAGAGG